MFADQADLPGTLRSNCFAVTGSVDLNCLENNNCVGDFPQSTILDIINRLVLIKSELTLSKIHRSNQQILSFVGTDFIEKTAWQRSKLFFTVYTTLFQSCIVVCVNVFSFKNREMLCYWYHISYKKIYYVLFLQGYDYHIENKSSKSHRNCDGLS